MAAALATAAAAGPLTEAMAPPLVLPTAFCMACVIAAVVLLTSAALLATCAALEGQSAAAAMAAEASNPAPLLLPLRPAYLSAFRSSVSGASSPAKFSMYIE